MSGPRDHGHQHGEAFCLMTYVCCCGHREVYWNSRDGVTPFCTGCPSCGGYLRHTDWRGDKYAPDHVPHPGQGVWRDGTSQEAEAFVRQRIEKVKGTEYECTPERAAALLASVHSEEAHVNTEFQKGWPMFYRHEAYPHSTPRNG